MSQSPGRPRPSVNGAGQSIRERALQAQLQQVEAERQKLAAEREAAERENEAFRKRALDQAERKLAWATEPLIRDLLDPLDNIERAINSTSDPNARDGLLAVYRQFLTTLSRHGVQGIAAQGQRFNVQFHEAMGTVEDPSQPNETVTAILRNGYTLNGRVIRPAQVHVNRLPAPSPLPAESPSPQQAPGPPPPAGPPLE